MAKFALLVELKAKPGKESEVEAFLEKEATIVRGEPGTLSWHAAKVEGEPGVYRIFDTFNDEVGREAHLKGEAGQELVEKADELFSPAPKVSKLQVFAQK
jgi:quinol monooxygenase YgiN